MVCPYCETENMEGAICSFCEADLRAARPRHKDYLSELDAYHPQPKLATFHTLDLCLLIRFLRKERSEAYKTMKMVQKGSELVEIDPETIATGEELYRKSTKHMKIIENILIDRLGYKPKRIDDKLIASLEAKMGQ